MRYRSRSIWTNHVGNQAVEPLRRYRPRSLHDLVEVVREAEVEGVPVRAVGSGHSFSDVVQTTGFLIDTDGLQGLLPLDKTTLHGELAVETLVNVEAGMKLHRLNALLEARGLALPNMGGYDGQSVAGACATSTHGSGLSFGPLNDFCRSIVLVTAGGTVYRVEPTKGITNPARHRDTQPDVELVQDDRWFNTVAVGMGCVGVIYSVILETVPKFWLNEKRFVCTWPEVKARLLDGRCLAENRHFEVLVNPYEVNGKRLCLVTERNETAEPRRRLKKTGRNFLKKYLGLMPVFLKVLDFVFDHFFQVIPRFINFAMRGLKDPEYVDISYNVLNLGAPNYLSAYSSELAFPLAQHRYLDAVEGMFAVAEKARRLGRLYHTSPVSLRFVKASSAHLSMMYGRDTCAVEIPLVNYTFGGYELLKLYEALAPAFDGRVHWGQINTVSTDIEKLAIDYPALSEWLDVYKRLNRTGVFNNDFTNRMGFSV